MLIDMLFMCSLMAAVLATIGSSACSRPAITAMWASMRSISATMAPVLPAMTPVSPFMAATCRSMARRSLAMPATVELMPEMVWTSSSMLRETAPRCWLICWSTLADSTRMSRTRRYTRTRPEAASTKKEMRDA